MPLTSSRDAASARQSRHLACLVEHHQVLSGLPACARYYPLAPTPPAKHQRLFPHPRWLSLPLAQIARHRSGRSAGFAIVTFATHEEASAAVRGMDSATFMGRPLSCRWYQQERDCAEGLLVQPPRQGSPALQAQQQLAQGQLPLPTQLQGNHHQSHMLASAAAAMTGPSGTGIPSPRRQEQQQQALRLQQQARGGMAFGAIDSAAAGRSKALLAPLSLEQWTSLPLSQAPAFSSHAAAAPGMSSEEGPDGVRRWSTMVNLWLQDYLNQVRARARDEAVLGRVRQGRRSEGWGDARHVWWSGASTVQPLAVHGRLSQAFLHECLVAVAPAPTPARHHVPFLQLEANFTTSSTCRLHP